MALIAALEADLRALSAESRRKYPAVKDAAEHAILKLRTLSDPRQIARNDDILKIFLLACEVKNAKLSVIGLSCLQKLIANDAVAPSALSCILSTLKELVEMNDETLQLKTLQIILTILQSQLHPEDEDNMAIMLGICLRLLGNNRNPDSVQSTAAATLRQAVALIFDRVVIAEALPAHKARTRNRTSRSNSVSGDVSRSIMAAKAEENVMKVDATVTSRDAMTKGGKLGLRLFEDLTALAAGGSATWLNIPSLQRSFALDMLEYVLSNYVSVFRTLRPYQKVLQHQVCSLLMTSLRTTGELEDEPGLRRLVLRCVANVIRLYNSIVMTECEVFLSMLVKSTDMELPLWHRIMVLEILRGFCIEARVLRSLFQTFDMSPENTNIVSSLVRALARVVTSVQVPDANEESLVAVAGMFNSKAKGIEWAMEYDASGASVVVASEAHAITLAVEGLLGVVFTVATLTDEAVEAGEVSSPRCESSSSSEMRQMGELSKICVSMVNSVWRTLLEALSLMLSRCQGEAIVLEILKGYQAFTQACGVLQILDPRDAFLASLCKFTLIQSNDFSVSNAGPPSPLLKRFDQSLELQEVVILTPKNVQALRTLFNIAHRLDSVLGSSWLPILETLAMLDRVIHSPHATTQEVSAVVPRLAREQSTQSSDFNILSTLDSQLFESSSMMSASAVHSLLAGLRQVSNSALNGLPSGLGQAATGNTGAGTSNIQVPQSGAKLFAVERMIAILSNNLYRSELLWDEMTAHFIELAEHESSQVRSVALDALDRSICLVLDCEQIKRDAVVAGDSKNDIQAASPISSVWFKSDAFECQVILPLETLYNVSQYTEVRGGSLRILLHVIERHGEKLHHSWPSILDLLRSVANTSEKDFVPLGFQSLRVIMNDGLLSIPSSALDMCVEVAGAYGAQKTDINISLTAIGLLWATSDFFARGVDSDNVQKCGIRPRSSHTDGQISLRENDESVIDTVKVDIPPLTEALHLTTISGRRSDMDCNKLLLAVFGVIQGLGTDERPEVRNSAIRTLFQSLSSHGYQLSTEMWEHCLWNLVFPLVDTVRHLAASSSNDEWTGRQLGVQGGKPVHMLVHHSRNTEQKQWDETLVLVLNGISRILRPFFLYFQTLNNFKEGWMSLISFFEESMLTNSKEVALAGISALQTSILVHAAKGNIPGVYFQAAFATYEKVTLAAALSKSKVAPKAKQELLQNLAELYAQAYSIFEDSNYLKMLALVDLLVRYSAIPSDRDVVNQGKITAVQRTALNVLPVMRPLDRLSSFWPVFVEQILAYLPGGEKINCLHCKSLQARFMKEELECSPQVLNGTALQFEFPIMNDEEKALCGPPSISDSQLYYAKYASGGVVTPAFAEKVLDIITNIQSLMPGNIHVYLSPKIVAALGRCMATRRDNPHSSLWRKAAQSFIKILDQQFGDSIERLSGADPNNRLQYWKELADLYESFLVGTCGRAVVLPAGESLSAEALKSDEQLETSILDGLCEKVFASCDDAPEEIIKRLITIIDQCANRTSALPIESAFLLPPHCGRFSLLCLQKLFRICSGEFSSNGARLVVSKLALPVLILRSDDILRRFSEDENRIDSTLLPPVRINELLFLLEELEKLVLHPAVATCLSHQEVANIPMDLKRFPGGEKLVADCRRAHLLFLFSPLCELVISRESKVSGLLHLILKHIGSELGLIQGTQRGLS